MPIVSSIPREVWEIQRKRDRENVWESADAMPKEEKDDE